jgi:nucleoside-diphosphate-sugar epimerase
MGASGFVGSHVTCKLVERADDVRVYLRKSSLTVAPPAVHFLGEQTQKYRKLPRVADFCVCSRS